MKAHHALDLPLLMDNVALSPRLTGNGPEAFAMAEMICETYIAFARTGNPNNPKIPAWPPYDLPRRATMAFDLTPRVINVTPYVSFTTRPCTGNAEEWFFTSSARTLTQS